LNSVNLVGRLTRDVEIRYTDGGASISRFGIAVDRRFKAEGQPTADFINCVAFGKTAEFVEKYFSKGQRIGLTGRIQTGSYTNKDGQKVYTTDVIAENVEFVESRGGQGESNVRPDTTDTSGFMNIPDDVGDEGLPFN
jgi:single-strand DNA-binding protein